MNGSKQRQRRTKSLFSAVQLLLLFIFLSLPFSAFAHRLDEYLQATLVRIEPDRIRLQVNLTPGVAVAEQVLGLIDRDRDGVISTNEAAAYAELFERDFTVRLDERNLQLKLTGSCFPGIDELRTGWGFVQMEFSARTGHLTAGAHTLAIENRHLPGTSVYLLNAAQPSSSSVQVGKQLRNENQSTGKIQFSYRPSPNLLRPIGAVALILTVAGCAFCGRSKVWRSLSPVAAFLLCGNVR